MSLANENRILDFLSGCVLAIRQLSCVPFSTALPAALKQFVESAAVERAGVYELGDSDPSAPSAPLLVSEYRKEQLSASTATPARTEGVKNSARRLADHLGQYCRDDALMADFNGSTAVSPPSESVRRRLMVSAPIEIEGKPWGFLRLDFPRAGVIWTNQHEMLVRSFASFLGAMRGLELAAQRSEGASVLSLSQLAAENEVAFELDDKGNWAFLSPAWDRLTGYSAHRALGSHHSRYFLHHPCDSSGELSQLDFLDGLTPNGTHSGEGLLKAEDGSHLWVSFLVRALPAREGFPPRYQGVLADIRNRKSQEAREQATARELQAKNADLLAALVTAQEATRLRGDFLATMSHEIRTPLNGVLGMTSLLLQTSLDRQQREFGQAIRSSAESLLSVVNSILDYSKLEAQRMDLEEVYYDPQVLVEEVFASLAEPASRKRIDLVAHPRSPLPAAVRGDPGKVRHVLLNLVGNAIKFSKMGEVAVAISWELLFGSNGELRFEVIDFGIGMSQETLGHLFRPFNQAVAATSRIYGGTGLGLVISKQFCELMGGEIQVESRVGFGSRFRVVLPGLCRDLTEDGQVEPAPLDFFRGKRILIAGVGDLSADAWIEAIREHGAEARRTANLASMVGLLSNEQSGNLTDIIIFDTRDQEEDASEINRRIRLATRNPQVFLVLLDSIHNPVDRSVLKGVDPLLVIRKPALPRRALAAVSAAQLAVAQAPRKPLQRFTRPLGEQNSGTAPVLLLASSERRRKCLAYLLRGFSVNLAVAENFQDLIQQAIGRQHSLVLLDADIGIHTEVEAARKLRATLGARVPPMVGVANSRASAKYLGDSGLFDDVLAEGFQRGDLQCVVERFASMHGASVRESVS